MGCTKDIPTFAWERWGICKACPHYRPELNKRAGIGCVLAPKASKCYRRRPLSVCPDEPPRWGPVDAL